MAVNPVWVPALGDLETPTTYFFLDTSSEGGTSYVYRVQGVTADGLTSVSEPVVARRP